MQTAPASNRPRATRPRRSRIGRTVPMASGSMTTGKSVASEGGKFEGKHRRLWRRFCLATMRYPNHFDVIAARLLSQRGIATVWELQVKAAAAFRRGNWLSAAGL